MISYFDKFFHEIVNSLSSQIEYSLIHGFPTSFGHDSGKGNTISDEKKPGNEISTLWSHK